MVSIDNNYGFVAATAHFVFCCDMASVLLWEEKQEKKERNLLSPVGARQTVGESEVPATFKCCRVRSSEKTESSHNIIISTEPKEMVLFIKPGTPIQLV